MMMTRLLWTDDFFNPRKLSIKNRIITEFENEKNPSEFCIHTRVRSFPVDVSLLFQVYYEVDGLLKASLL